MEWVDANEDKVRKEDAQHVNRYFDQQQKGSSDAQVRELINRALSTGSHVMLVVNADRNATALTSKIADVKSNLTQSSA